MKLLLTAYLLFSINTWAGSVIPSSNQNCTENNECVQKSTAVCCGKKLELTQGCFHKDEVAPTTRDCSKNQFCAKRIAFDSCACIRPKCVPVFTTRFDEALPSKDLGALKKSLFQWTLKDSNQWRVNDYSKYVVAHMIKNGFELPSVRVKCTKASYTVEKPPVGTVAKEGISMTCAQKEAGRTHEVAISCVLKKDGEIKRTRKIVKFQRRDVKVDLRFNCKKSGV